MASRSSSISRPYSSPERGKPSMEFMPKTMRATANGRFDGPLLDGRQYRRNIPERTMCSHLGVVDGGQCHLVVVGASFNRTHPTESNDGYPPARKKRMEDLLRAY